MNRNPQQFSLTQALRAAVCGIALLAPTMASAQVPPSAAERATCVVLDGGRAGKVVTPRATLMATTSRPG